MIFRPPKTIFLGASRPLLQWINHHSSSETNHKTTISKLWKCNSNSSFGGMLYSIFWFHKNPYGSEKSQGSKKFLWFRKNPSVPKSSYGLQKILWLQRIPMVWNQGIPDVMVPKNSHGLEKFLWFQKIPMIWESSNGLVNDRSSYGSKCARKIIDGFGNVLL